MTIAQSAHEIWLHYSIYPVTFSNLQLRPSTVINYVCQ